MGKTREAGELLSNNLLTGDHSAETINVGTAITFYGGTTGIISATSYSGSGANLTGLTGVAAGTYGDSSNIPQITIDSTGKVSGITEVAASGGGGGVSESLAIAYAVAL